LDRTTLKKLYIGKKLSKKEIAERLKVPEGRVRYFIMKYELKRREENSTTDESLKVCPQCGVEKKRLEFYMRSSYGVKRHGSWCKECVGKKSLNRNRSFKASYVRMKGGSCQACGFDRYDGALEFHHADPTTKDNIIARMTRNPSSPKLLAELEKCVLVCSNCHKMIHAKIIECPPLTPIILDKKD
jgi:5-methylcytosine-specific restriction endonuclease McrA